MAWWHEEPTTPTFLDLFEYLLAHADVWQRPLRTEVAADDDDDVSPMIMSLEWRFVAPGPSMFTKADPFFNPDQRKRKREEEEEDEDEGSCETCHRAPRAPNKRSCAGCLLEFAKEGRTPPGFIRNRAQTLRPACRVCGEKPARKNGTKCESCVYMASTKACEACGATGVKIAKGYCPACVKRARKGE